ncbi:MAG: hypothetical protein L0Y56_01410 [Nitrospira sp.]|nr:hypothetical protein [Nitrospira sp.]
MILEGAALGGMTLLGLGVVYKRLPQGVQTFVCRHPLLTDCVLVVFFYKLMGMSLIAHVAVATMTLGTQAFFHVERNKEDYQFLYDLARKGNSMMSEGLNKLKDIVKELGGEQAKLKSVA